MRTNKTWLAYAMGIGTLAMASWGGIGCDGGTTGSDEGAVTQKSPICGGIAGLLCPDGLVCVADAACEDGGVDCAGTCESPPPCAGFAGLMCPDGLTCVPPPGDTCWEQGGADCGGICVACPDDAIAGTVEAAFLGEIESFGIACVVYVRSSDGALHGLLENENVDVFIDDAGLAAECPQTALHATRIGLPAHSSASAVAAIDDQELIASLALERAADDYQRLVGAVQTESCGAQPKSCGGIAGLRCDEGELCHFEKDAACGFADALGVCEPKPEVCGEIFEPVCGCDGRDYQNPCEANAAGTSTQFAGSCACGEGETEQFCFGQLQCVPLGAQC